MSRTHRLQQAAETILELIGPLRIRYCPLTPTPRQEAFLRLQAREGLYGGAAGGGKSVALAMSALQYCDVPGYHALILRPSLPEFDLPGGLIDLTHQWLARSNAQWSGDTRTWTFPGPGPAGTGGATLRFGYLDGIKDVHRYSGSSFAYVGFDELVRFLSPNTGACSASSANHLPRDPPRRTGRHHADSGADPCPRNEQPRRPRPRLGQSALRRPRHAPRRRHLPALPVDRQPPPRPRRLHRLAQPPPERRTPASPARRRGSPSTASSSNAPGSTSSNPTNSPTTLAPSASRDLAATEPSPANSDPDYTVGLRLDLHEKTGTYYVTDIVRVRKAPGTIE